MVSVAIVVEPYGLIGEGELAGQFAKYEGLYQRADEGGGLPGAPQAHSGEGGCEPGVGQEQFWRGDRPGGEVAGPGGGAAGGGHHGGPGPRSGGPAGPASRAGGPRGPRRGGGGARRRQ